MVFHVPYSQRQKHPPVYIGFETPPAYRPRRTNWWGISGLLLAFGGLITCGFFSPVAFLISLVGLGQRPRKTAGAGTVISLVGMGIAASLVMGSYSNQMQRREFARQKMQAIEVAQQVEQGTSLLASAVSELEGFRNEHDGEVKSTASPGRRMDVLSRGFRDRHQNDQRNHRGCHQVECG